MIFTLWFVIIGLIFILMALSTSILKRLPLTTSLVYLVIGFLLAISGSGLLNFHPIENAAFLERLTEVAVLISLFSTGLKLRVPLQDGRWIIPLRLAFGSMIITIGLVTLAGVFLLHLPLGAAILLGAILAPTDPVLASDVQVENATDRDRLRFGLTGEAGLNDGSAFPFVMLGLGLLGLHDLGEGGWKWWTIDVVWALVAGLGIGALCGAVIGRLVVYLRREYKEAVGLDDFLALGLIALSYGLALLLNAYGFLAVFAAGVALRRMEMSYSNQKEEEIEKELSAVVHDAELATHPEKAPAYMTQAMLGFSEHLERIGEVLVVVLIGGLLATINFTVTAFWLVLLLLAVIRPLSVQVGLIGSRTNSVQRSLMAWFGIRGIGSIYYLMFAIEHGLPRPLAEQITSLTLTAVAISIVVHGISVTPLMNLYSRLRGGRTLQPAKPTRSR